MIFLLMIPKIIHLCWLSGDSFPENIQECIDSWKKYLPDYEIRLWDTKRFNINSTLWTQQAFAAKKYAFAADYIRLYALYTEGGIYLDSDVLVYKSFNDLLDLPYFIGQDFVGAFEPAIIGCEKGTPWIKDVLDAYDNRAFIKEDGTFDMHNLPIMFFERLYPKYNFTCIHRKDDFNYNKQTITLFDKNFFNSRNNLTIIHTPQSYCSHKFAASWSNHKRKGIKSTLFQIAPMWLCNWVLGINYHIIRKAIVHQYDPIYRQKQTKNKTSK